MRYIYDGSFEGMLSCFYEHVYTEHADWIGCSEDGAQLSIIPAMQVITDPVKAEKVAVAIEKKISRAAFQRTYRAFCSCEEGREMDILRYVFLGFKLGYKIDSLHGKPETRRIDELCHKVGRETERMLGLLRFGIVYGPGGREIMYASFKPDCYLIQNLMPHFMNRFRREPFIIHDVGREIAAFSYGGSWEMRSLPKDFSPEYTTDEQSYQELWKEYFNTAAISQRINREAQRRFIPSRYWQYLTEMDM